MRDLKLSGQALVRGCALAAVVLIISPLSWAQSGSTAVPLATTDTDDTARAASIPPPVATQPASESSNASSTPPPPARNEVGDAMPTKEFKPSEEIVEDQAVSFPVDI